MSKFLETLISKVFDFLNFGRILSIFFPGFLLAFSVAMFISILSPPITLIGDIQPITKSSPDNVSYLVKISQKENSFAWVIQDNTIMDIISSTIQEKEDLIKGVSTFEKKEEIFTWRIQYDFRRIINNLNLVLIFTFPLGFLIYQTAYYWLKKKEDSLINPRPPKESENPASPDLKIYAYQNDNNSMEISRRFEYSTTPVGTVYFAPFLKEKFSGEGNYYDLLITEYYRFLEFSFTLLISFILCWVVSFFYYLYFHVLYVTWPFLHDIKYLIFTIVLLIIVSYYYFNILPKSIERYLVARRDLINGVTDFMKKGLAEKEDSKLTPSKPSEESGKMKFSKSSFKQYIEGEKIESS